MDSLSRRLMEPWLSYSMWQDLSDNSNQEGFDLGSRSHWPWLHEKNGIVNVKHTFFSDCVTLILCNLGPRSLTFAYFLRSCHILPFGKGWKSLQTIVLEILQIVHFFKYFKVTFWPWPYLDLGNGCLHLSSWPWTGSRSNTNVCVCLQPNTCKCLITLKISAQSA